MQRRKGQLGTLDSQPDFQLRWTDIIIACLLLFVGKVADSNADVQSSASETQFKLFEDFEAVHTTWQIERCEDLVGILGHRRTDISPHAGMRNEQISIVARRGGERILATHEIPRSAAIDEFNVSVWLKGSQNGYQLMGRVRLPHSPDKSDEPMFVLIPGDRYTAKGRWQQLSVSNVRPKIRKAVRELRLRARQSIDASEAYLDAVVVNLFGSAGKNHVQLDDLAVTASVSFSSSSLSKGGAVPPRVQQIATLDRLPSDPQFAHRFHLRQFPLGIVRSPSFRAGSSPFGGNKMRHFVARAVVYHGESFGFLKQLGFNTVWLETPVTSEQLVTASEHDLWVVSPPAVDLQLPRLLNSPHENRILAWCIQRNVEFDSAFRVRIRNIKSSDPRKRPVLVSSIRPDETMSLTNAKVVDNGPNVEKLKASRVSRDHQGNWVALGTPLVASSRWRPLREEIWRSVVLGYGGILFNNAENLEQVSSQHTRNLAELFNMELRMLHPWIGRRELESDVIRSRDYQAYRVSDDHTDLVFVSPASHVGSPSNTKSGRATIPRELQIATAHHRDVYRVEPGSLSNVVHRRVAGGIRVSLDSNKPDGMLLLTDRSSVVHRMTKFLRSNERRTLDLMQQVIHAELLHLNRRLQSTTIRPEFRSHLRDQMHGLHGRIAWLLDAPQNGTANSVTFRELDHVLGQLERIQQSLDSPSVRRADVAQR